MFSNYNYTSIGGSDNYTATMVFGAIFAILLVAIIGTSTFLYRNPDSTNKTEVITILVISCVLVVLLAVGFFLFKRFNQ
jgi:uncharacterized membrane protein YgaE (UPF0421/DUF939 family)